MERKNASALFMLALLIFSTLSCKKGDSDVTPETDLGAAAAGTYLITSTADASGKVTAIPASANYTVVITKVSTKSASFVQNGSSKTDIGTVNLGGSTSSITLDLSDSYGKLTGTITNSNQLNYSVTKAGDSKPEIVITATKK